MDISYAPGKYLVIVSAPDSDGDPVTLQGEVEVEGDGNGITHDQLIDCWVNVFNQDAEFAHYTYVSLVHEHTETSAYVLNLELYSVLDEETCCHVFYTILSPERSVSTALGELLDIMSEDLIVVGFSFAQL